MNRFFVMITILFLGLSSVWAGQAGNPREMTVAPKPSITAPLPLGPVKNRPVIEGCTCEFQQPNARVKGSPDLVFISDLGWESARVHVDEDIPLKKISAPARMSNRKGEKVKIKFAGPDDLKVDLDLSVGNVCPPSEPCDTVGFGGTMSLSRGTQKTTTVVVGQCGC